MNARKILMIVGDYTEDYEAMVPFQALQMAGHEVHAACPGKKSGETIVTAIHDFEGEQTYSEKRGHHFRLNASWSQMKAESYDALLLPGGRAPEYLRLDASVLQAVAHFMGTGKPVGAICHGIQILTAADAVKGRKLTGYPAVKPEVLAAGGHWVETAMDQCCADGNLVTAPAWPAHPRWLKALTKALDAHHTGGRDKRLAAAKA